MLQVPQPEAVAHSVPYMRNLRRRRDHQGQVQEEV